MSALLRKGLSIRIETFHDGAFATKRYGDFDGLGLNIAPNVEFFFQEKLLLDDEPLLDDWAGS